MIQRAEGKGQRACHVTRVRDEPLPINHSTLRYSMSWTTDLALLAPLTRHGTWTWTLICRWLQTTGWQKQDLIDINVLRRRERLVAMPSPMQRQYAAREQDARKERPMAVCQMLSSSPTVALSSDSAWRAPEWGKCLADPGRKSSLTSLLPSSPSTSYAIAIATNRRRSRPIHHKGHHNNHPFEPPPLRKMPQAVAEL